MKLAVWPGFTLPDLTGLTEGVTVTPVEEQRLSAVYYDTPDFRLARAGASLRHRTGDGTGWTVKLPVASAPGAKGSLDRLELTFAGPASKVPARASSLVVSMVRTSTLRAVVRLRTRRKAVKMIGPEGGLLAEIVDDEVSVLKGGRVAMRFREVEVEAGPDAESGFLDEVVARIMQAGAGEPDPTPKLRRALGPVAEAEPDLVERAVGKGATAAEVVQGAITNSVLQVFQHDPGVRLGTDPESVHKARVGTRRLRSDLRTFKPLLDADWADQLREELSWLADALGDVRDSDVRAERLARQLEMLSAEDQEAGQAIVAVSMAEGERARRRLLSALDDRRYADLLDRLVEAAVDPRVAPEAGHPATAELPGLVDRPWKHLRKAAEQAMHDEADEALHETRIRAKRCRYAAEVAALVVGKPAQRFADAVADIQGVLGDHQDAVVAEAWLRRLDDGDDRAVTLVIGQLVAMQRIEAAAHRRAWPEIWSRASKAKLRSWL